jgi:glycosyltransferase involved in cell wall biosynthesis
MKLLIAIPAYNEEGSIRTTITRCLDARRTIIDRSPVNDVEIVVVSDGSTDRTAELARSFEREIRFIEFSKNRGYGAAIKAAWEGSDADLLGFLDADGTCDPEVFAEFCVALVESDADMVVGCRLHRHSRMPAIRRAGNRAFALALTFLSGKRVRDTASGMRVLRRSALPKLLPLPNRMHFTPAMSAKAVLEGSLRAVEIDMPYYEREGESKLQVWKDGLRFARVILGALVLYQPARPLAVAGAACAVVALGLMAEPIAHYSIRRSVPEWMMYRFIVSHLLGTAAILAFCAAHLTSRLVAITITNKPGPNLWGRCFHSRLVRSAPVLMLAGAAALVFPSAVQLAETGRIVDHWSRFVTMSFLTSGAMILATARVIDYTMGRVAAQLSWMRSRAEDRSASIAARAGVHGD